MADKILVSDLQRHTSVLQDEILSTMATIVESGWFIHGASCAAFERDFAHYCGTTYCIGVANGTDALELALRSLGVRAGSRVATVANAGFYTTAALIAIGAKPEFVDVDPNTHLMDLDGLSAVVEAGNIDAIVITHLFGLMHDMAAVRAIVDQVNIPVLEDCAQAHGAKRNGMRAGSVGHVATFSFYPTKNLGAIGDGGAIVTNSEQIAARARLLRQYGWDVKYRTVALGGRNSRLDELQAAVLDLKLPHLDQWNARRRQIAAQYSRGIRHNGVVCPPEYGDEYVAHLYVVKCNERDALRRHLDDVGIGSDIHYPIPDHRQPSLATTEQWPELPVTEHVSSVSLTLPCFPELTDREVQFIIDRVNAW